MKARKAREGRDTDTGTRATLLEFLEAARVGEELARETPHLLGRVLQRRRRLALEQVEVGQEVVWTATALQTRDQLQQDPVDAVAEARLVPLDLSGMLLALVQQKRLDMVGGDGVPGEVQMTVSQCLEDAETAAPAAAQQQTILRFVEAEHPGVALHGRLFALQCYALLRQEVEALGLDVADEAGVRPGYVWNGPVSRAARPHAAAFEGWCDLHHVSLSDTQLHFCRIGNHLDRVPIRALVARLSHQGLET